MLQRKASGVGVSGSGTSAAGASTPRGQGARSSKFAELETSKPLDFLGLGGLTDR